MQKVSQSPDNMSFNIIQAAAKVTEEVKDTQLAKAQTEESKKSANPQTTKSRDESKTSPSFASKVKQIQIKEEIKENIPKTNPLENSKIPNDPLEIAHNIVRSWVDNASDKDIFKFLNTISQASRLKDSPYIKTEASIFKAEELLEQLGTLDVDSEITTMETEIDENEAKELQEIENFERYLQASWESLQALAKEQELARLLIRKGIKRNNANILEKNMKEKVSDTYITVLKLSTYKLKMRVQVNRDTPEIFKASFYIKRN